MAQRFADLSASYTCFHLDTPQSFREVIGVIRENEGEAIIREFGLGLNKAMGKRRPLNNVTAFERQQGLHLSIGKKHNVFKKPGIKANHARYHIDMFVDVRKVIMDGDTVYQDGEFVIPVISSETNS